MRRTSQPAKGRSLQQVQAIPAFGAYSDPLPELSGVLPDEN